MYSLRSLERGRDVRDRQSARTHWSLKVKYWRRLFNHSRNCNSISCKRMCIYTQALILCSRLCGIVWHTLRPGRLAAFQKGNPGYCFYHALDINSPQANQALPHSLTRIHLILHRTLFNQSSTWRTHEWKNEWTTINNGFANLGTLSFEQQDLARAISIHPRLKYLFMVPKGLILFLMNSHSVNRIPPSFSCSCLSGATLCQVEHEAEWRVILNGFLLERLPLGWYNIFMWLWTQASGGMSWRHHAKAVGVMRPRACAVEVGPLLRRLPRCETCL